MRVQGNCRTLHTGDDYRLLVVGNHSGRGRLARAGTVIGDGRSTIRELVDEVNRDPRRSDGHGSVLSFIKLTRLPWVC